MKIRIKKVPKAQGGMQMPPRIDTRQSQFNALLGIQPSVQLNQGMTEFTPSQPVAPSLAWQPVELAPPPKAPAPAGPMFKVENRPVDFSAALDPNKNPIFDDWTKLGQTYQTGSAKDFKAALKDFNQTYDANVQDNRLVKFGAQGRAIAKGIDDAGDTMRLGIGLMSSLSDRLQNNRRQQDYNRYLRNQLSSDALYRPEAGSRGDYVTTGSRFGEFRPDDYVTNRGMFAEEGGEYTTPMKIRITASPKQMAYGGQLGYGLDLGARRVYTDMPEDKRDTVSSTITGVPRSQANIEAEGGETVLADVDQDGAMEHMKISGPRHSEGGVPLNVPEGSFIYSDTKKMKIKDPAILKMFGTTYKKGGVTPAQIAKKYDINKYKAIMEDPNADELAKSTAQIMVKNYQDKLADLAMVQEGMKGFPQGIPQVAQLSEAAYGGYVPQFNTGGLTSAQKEQELIKDYPWLKPWLKSNTKAGRTTPTGKDSTYNDKVENLYSDIRDWEKIANRKFNNLEDLQGYVYSSIDQTDPDTIKNMWKEWGNTAKNKSTDVSNFVDNIMGSRTASLLKYRPKKVEQPAAPKTETTKPQQQRTVESVKPNEAEFTNQELPFGYMTPDLVNMAATAMVPPKKYLPFRAPVRLPRVSPTFMDPNREIAAQNEAANMLAQNAASFANPQAFMANASRLQGNLAEGVANTMARTQGQNVNIANQFAGINADLIGRENMLAAQRANELFDGNVIANQQFDNARRTYNRNLGAAFNQAWSNRMNLGMMNAVNPLYRVDPRTGKSYFTGKGYGTESFGRAAQSNDPLAAYANVQPIKQRLMESGLSESEASAEALRIIRGSGATSYTDNNMDGIVDRTTTTRRGEPMDYLNQFPFMFRRKAGGPVMYNTFPW